jgi:hypothetical protein
MTMNLHPQLSNLIGYVNYDIIYVYTKSLVSTYCKRMEVQPTKTDPYIIEKRVQIDRTDQMHKK